MQCDGFILNVTTEKREGLVAFYRDVVKLEQDPNLGEGAFKVAEGAHLMIDGHSEVHGTAKEPQRYLINFFVNDLAAEQRRLEEQGVTFIRSAGREAWGGTISTFLDPDGNYCQLIEFKG